MMPAVFHSHSTDLQHHPWVLLILMNIKVNKAAVHQCKGCTFHLLVQISRLEKVDLFLNST